MKGIVFTEFIEMVDDKFGLEITEELIHHSNTLSTGGSYTAVGTYPHGELVEMVVLLSKKTNIPVKDLLETFGEYLFGVLSKTYDGLMNDIHSLFDFLMKIEDYIHVEVRKLYPEAELPTFEIEKGDNSNEIVMIYKSERALSDFGVGLILGASSYFKEPVTVTTTDLTEEKNGKLVKIHIVKN